jgi:hypothetical protein
MADNAAQIPSPGAVNVEQFKQWIIQKDTLLG